MQITKDVLLKLAADQNKFKMTTMSKELLSKRTEEKIQMSLVAEIAEWNEERGGYSHKDWKVKEFDKEKHDLEFIDILMFALEWSNKTPTLKSEMVNTINHKAYLRMFKANVEFYKSYYEMELLSMLFGGHHYIYVISYLLAIAEQEEIDVIGTFYKKLKINYARFGYDYNMETGEVVKRAFEIENQSSAVCPYCGNKGNNCEDVYFDGHEYDCFCDKCKRYFTYETDVKIKYSSFKNLQCRDCEYYSEDTQHCEKCDEYLDFDEGACTYFKVKIKGWRG